MSSFNQFAAGRKSFNDFKAEATKLSESQIKAGLNAIDEMNKNAEKNGFEKIAIATSNGNSAAINLNGSELSNTGLGQNALASNDEESVSEEGGDARAPAFKKPLAFKKEKILGDLDFLLLDGSDTEVDNSRGIASLEEDGDQLAQLVEGSSDKSPTYNRDGYSNEGIDQNRNHDLFKVISKRYRRKFFAKQN